MREEAGGADELTGQAHEGLDDDEVDEEGGGLRQRRADLMGGGHCSQGHGAGVRSETENTHLVEDLGGVAVGALDGLEDAVTHDEDRQGVVEEEAEVALGHLVVGFADRAGVTDDRPVGRESTNTDS